MSKRMNGRLEPREDEELAADLEERRAEWQEKGGRPWAAVERDMQSLFPLDGGKIEMGVKPRTTPLP